MFDQHFTAIFYFFFGLFTCLVVQILLKPKKSDEYMELMPQGSRFYLNIFFLNSKEVKENIVRSKVTKRRPILRALGKRLAVNLISDEKLMEKIGQDLISSIPPRLELLAIQASASVVYIKSAFICIEVDLLSIDLPKLIEENAGLEKSQKIVKLFEWLDIPYAQKTTEISLVKLLASKVKNALPNTIQQKLQDKLIAEVEIVVLEDDEQGAFLCQTIKQLNKIPTSEKSAAVSAVPE